MLLKIYTFLTSLRLSVILLLLLTADLSLGYIFLHGNTSFYEPMNQVGLLRWLMTYGQADPYHSAWFFVLLFLLACLVVNTVLCTCDKLYHLFSSKKTDTALRGVRLTLFIHLMHVAMVLLLGGYLLSYTGTTIYNSMTLNEKGRLQIPGSSISLELVSMELQPYQGKRNESFTGRYLDARSSLRFQNGAKVSEKTFSINNPISYAGYSFFLQRFNPRQQGGIHAARYIVIDIRKDPGAKLTFTGMALFIAGFCGYILLRKPPRVPRRTS